MSYTLRVLFSGLCAFVPNRPFDDFDTPPTEVTVLLQNLLNPQSLSTVVDSGVLEPHYPMVEFDLCDLHPQSPRRADLERTELGKGACMLIGEEISFDMNQKVRKGLRLPGRDRQPDDRQEQATSRDEDSLRWLARIDKASPAALLDPKVLTQALSLKEDTAILARLRIDEGFLRVSKRSEKVCEFHPLDPSNPYRQQIALEMALDFESVEGPVVLVGRDPKGKEQRLVLSPVKSPQLLEIRIQNREIGRLLGVPEELMPVQEVADFEVFYQLLSEDVLVGQVRRFPKQPVPGGTNVKNPSLCPPTGLTLRPAA